MAVREDWVPTPGGRRQGRSTLEPAPAYTVRGPEGSRPGKEGEAKVEAERGGTERLEQGSKAEEQRKGSGSEEPKGAE